MFLLRSESESSAGFQPAVSQDFILQTEQTCQKVQVNSIGLQIKNLRYWACLEKTDTKLRGFLVIISFGEVEQMVLVFGRAWHSKNRPPIKPI
jgi:hypothetical protein